MPRDEEFRAKEKKYHKMTRDGLVERGADSGEEIRISERERDFDLRQARDSPIYGDMSTEARHSRQRQQKENPLSEKEAASESSDFHSEDSPLSSSEEPVRDSRKKSKRYQQKFTESNTASESVSEQPRTSKLQFADDELPPEPPGKKLTKARLKAERTAQKLEKAEQNLPARCKLRLEVEPDAETGNAKHRLKFEKEVISQAGTLKRCQAYASCEKRCKCRSWICS